MQRLTKIQIEHFTARVDKLLDARRRIEREELGPRPVVPQYTFEEQVDLIRRKKATLKSNGKFSSHTHLVSCFDFPVSPAMARAKANQERWDAKARVIDDRIKAERTRVIDTVILGDTATALQAIQVLELKLAKA